MAVPISRRRLLEMGVAGAAALLGGACGGGTGQGTPGPREDRSVPGSAAVSGRLSARPGQPSEAGPVGEHRLGLDRSRDGLLYVPPSYRAEAPAPLALMLHGAGGGAQGGLGLLRPLADAAGIILLAPDSRDRSWDAVLGGYGPDVAFIDRALARTFQRYAIDPGRVAIGGFSDGASYALSLGAANGDLFTHLIAFSPGFLDPPATRGRPRIFVSHGIQDRVLPIERCSRRIVPRARSAGYAVEYREFDGPHTVPSGIARAAVEWFVGPGA